LSRFRLQSLLVFALASTWENGRRERPKTKTKWRLGWVGALAGLPVIAAGFRRVSSRGAKSPQRLLIVRTTVDPELVTDLADLVQRVRGRAALNGKDSFSVPVPDGVPEDAAHRELRALLETWELRHPDVRAEIVRA
jgi:hypothetical protein